MKIPDADQRQCKTCLKPYPLNLFRVDGNVCRYCENGIAAHPKLYERIQSKKGLDIPKVNKKEPLKNIEEEQIFINPETTLEKASNEIVILKNTIETENNSQKINSPNSDKDNYEDQEPH